MMKQRRRRMSLAWGRRQYTLYFAFFGVGSAGLLFLPVSTLRCAMAHANSPRRAIRIDRDASETRFNRCHIYEVISNFKFTNDADHWILGVAVAVRPGWFEVNSSPARRFRGAMN